MAKLRISLLQMKILPGMPQHNRDNAAAMINAANEHGPDIIVLPEMWTTAYELDRIKEICDKEGMPTAELLSKHAAQRKVNLVAGSFASLESGKVYNTAYIFDRQGNNIAKYRKIHMFKLMNEHSHISSGKTHCVFELDGIKCGIIICYDLRFPELIRKLALEGIKLLFVPAQWPAARLEHWKILLRARAIENQIFIAAVNAAGESSEDEFQGGSMLINPWGEIIAEADYKQQIITADIDLQQISEIRSKIDILGDRVPEAY